MSEEQKFPSEVIDLPSEGKVYPSDSPLAEGKLEIKYMTAREEDILTSQNLIKKGLVIDKLLDSLILTKGVNIDDLVLGDKNALMVAARILAYGPSYTCDVTNPKTGETIEANFNLADCPFKKVPKDVTNNNFSMELPVSKAKITFKLLTGKEEKLIDKEIKQMKKLGGDISHELTTRLKNTIISVNDNSELKVIRDFVDNMLSRDSLYFRGEVARLTPDIEMKQEIEIGGEMVEVVIPLTANFFWPTSQA